MPTSLTPSQRRIAESLAAAIIPAGRVFPAAGARTVAQAEKMLAASSVAGWGFGKLLDTLEHASLLRGGRFSRLDADAQERTLRRWENDPLWRWPLFVLAGVFKMTHFEDPEIYKAMGCVFEKGGPAEPARWLRSVHRGGELTSGETIECDVVVIGTGAGGGVVGRELVEKGLAVAFVEEGELHRRESFTGSATHARNSFYRQKGTLVALGNSVMPILAGRMVGGSTAINTGTCFRTPSWILDDWCDRLSTNDFSTDAMAPHFDRVERQLGVETARAEYLGGIARVVARGCEALGWRHFPLRRNAPDCDGQGVCDYGCPTGARRSTDLSYIPPALTAGAELYTGTHARRVLIENGRCVGLACEAKSASGERVDITFRARAVVLAGGAVPSPVFLLEQGICNGSGQVGKNLSVHPSTAVSALFEEKIEMYNAIPQGYGCDQFHREGAIFLGAGAPLDFGAMMFPFNGRRLSEAMSAFDRVASLGILVEDEGRGRVRRAPGGGPLVSYWMKPRDVERLQMGISRVAELFFAAGARTVFPLLPRVPVLESKSDLARFRTTNLRTWDFLCTSFHPLGTCRMGRDARTSVVDLDHQAHELPGLFIVDGSTVPTPPAVNPQLTIMAMADRAAERIATILS